MTSPGDPENEAERFERLHQASLDHPARLARIRWDAWGIVASAMATNERQALEVIDAPTKDERLALEIVRNVGGVPGLRQRFIGEVYRLLHNYLASVATLVHHSRNLLGNYPDTDFLREYEERLRAIRDEPVTKFVQDLRNVLLHHGLPTIESELTFPGPANSSKGIFSMRLNRDHLLSIERFTAKARTYLRAQDATFPLRSPITEYAELNQGLNSWIGAQFATLHGDDIDDYNSLVDQMRPSDWPPRPPSTNGQEATPE